MRPYRLFGATERGLLHAAAEETLRAWAEDWLPAATARGAECAPACEAAPRLAAVDGWACVPAEREGWVACASPQAAAAALATGIYGAAASALATAAAAQALRDLMRRFAAGAGADWRAGEDASPPADAWLAGTAAFSIGIAVATARVDLVVGPGWTRATLDAQPPRRERTALASRREALERQPVGLAVLAGTLEVDLRTLRALVPGDVVALDTPLREPLRLVVAAAVDRVVGRGRLGARRGRRALALQGVA
jgi:flagellar motor switch/type III secretory pathway protein FliN